MTNVLATLLLMLPFAALAQGFAVVELFTSQGCSSCPAADRNLTQLLKESEKAGTSVYALSFHVDYWNHIGWKDPYSNKKFTERQKTYASVMHLNSLYTPQMIVNGESEFVGSDLGNARNILADALLEQHALAIQITGMVVADGIVSFDYVLNKDVTEGSLNAAIVVRGVENFVSRGENKGKTLHHDNVVMEFVTTQLKKKDRLSMKIPPGTGDNASLIIYAQDRQLEILAATSQRLK
jgi:hypothetical protein